MSLNEFNIGRELELAARIPYVDLELPLAWSAGYDIDDGESASCTPTVWRVEGGKVVVGYVTAGMCVVFVDHPLDEERASSIAVWVTKQCCAV